MTGSDGDNVGGGKEGDSIVVVLREGKGGVCTGVSEIISLEL
jgi:hypothetical protein